MDHLSLSIYIYIYREREREMYVYISLSISLVLLSLSSLSSLYMSCPVRVVRSEQGVDRVFSEPGEASLYPTRLGTISNIL